MHWSSVEICRMILCSCHWCQRGLHVDEEAGPEEVESCFFLDYLGRQVHGGMMATEMDLLRYIHGQVQETVLLRYVCGWGQEMLLAQYGGEVVLVKVTLRCDVEVVLAMGLLRCSYELGPAKGSWEFPRGH